MPKFPQYLLAASFLTFIYVFIQTAWISQDAFITYRVLDNAVNGYGLTWNIHERVQAYTHPLWLLLHLPFYSITHEATLTSILISAACTLLTIYIIAKRFSQQPLISGIIILLLTCSRAFMDYTTSGLENPLTYLLTTLFYIHSTKPNPHISTLILLTALAGLTRLDNLLLLLPPLMYLLYKHKDIIKPRQILLPTLPLILWHLFSLIYYGTPFPNTAYAKLNNPFPYTTILAQGLYYLKYSLVDDSLTLTTITLTIIAAATQKKNHIYLLLTLGILTHITYTVWIGGDFMTGRFLSTPLLLATLTLPLISPHTRLHAAIKKIPYLIPLTIILTSFLSYQTPLLNTPRYTNTKITHGIADERGYYYHSQGLRTAVAQLGNPTYSQTPQSDTPTPPNRVIIMANIGSEGFNAGPQFHIIDELALSDPLLARLPPSHNQEFRPGHLKRDIPLGYIESIQSGQNLIQDPYIAHLYDQINLKTKKHNSHQTKTN